MVTHYTVIYNGTQSTPRQTEGDKMSREKWLIINLHVILLSVYSVFAWFSFLLHYAQICLC